MTENNTISTNYSDARLRILVEEFITQQRGAFTLKDVCSYILYWAKEEGKASQVGGNLYKSDKICQADCDRVRRLLGVIAEEGRISVDEEQYRKVMN